MFSKKLFPNESIIEIQELSPGYEDHASDVWLVKTTDREVIVRSSKMVDEPSNAFWWGCHNLFGIDPRRLTELNIIHQTLSKQTQIPIPTLFDVKKIDEKEFALLEKLQGATIHSFIDQHPSMIKSLGAGLAGIHSIKRDYIGSPSRTFHVSLNQFHSHVTETMSQLVSRFYDDKKDFKELLHTTRTQLQHIPHPESSTFVLVDIDPTQFLSDGNTITGLVDTEAYVVAPRELDFIGLEYVLDEPSAAAFKEGYQTVLELPQLEHVRIPYRFLYRLLSVQGNVELETWMNQKILF
jgi:aminoglycoside phosphotransferase (APT) family kinase protein